MCHRQRWFLVLASCTSAFPLPFGLTTIEDLIEPGFVCVREGRAVGNVLFAQVDDDGAVVRRVVDP